VGEHTRILGLAAVLSLAAAVPAFAQSKVGTTFGEFLLIEPSARIAAMGNAGASVTEGLDAAYYNPAAIARLNRYGVHFSHASWFANIDYNYAAASIPLGKWGSAFTSVTALGSGDIEVRTVDQPLGTGERFSVSDIAIGVGYGKEITDRFSMGVQFSYLQETIWHNSAGTGVISFGTLYRISDNGLRLGASLSNFGTQAAYSGRDLRTTFDQDPTRNGDNGTLPAEQFTDGFAVPVLFRAGLSLPVRLDDDVQLDLALDALHPSDNTESVCVGAELLYRRSVALRWGWQNPFQQDTETGLTIGAGYQGDAGGHRINVDYGWADYGRLGSINRFSFGWMF
jgi:hypothetical protein